MDKPGHLKAMREVFALADKMLCRTESLGRDLVALGCPAEKIAIWRTGVPLAEWRYLPREVPEEGAWKLLHQDGHRYLFDLSGDGRETVNLIGRHPAIAASLQARLEAWEATMPPIPGDAHVDTLYPEGTLPSPTA